MTTAVLLLAYGGPDSLDDIPAYLLDIRGGRETPQHLIDEITERYRLIGGCSPLLPITRSAAAKLQAELDIPVYVGMRHWRPFIRETVAQMLADGVDHIIAVCMAPHYSSLSIGAYKARLEEALAESTASPAVTLEFVDSWYTQPEYLDAVAANVAATLERFPTADRDDVLVVFTAHSLPEFILQRGDPYDRQLHETAELLAQRLLLPADRWTFSYQSAAQTGVPWLGPQIEALIPELAAQDRRNILVAPVGFIADHVEVLYDIDIGVQAIAARSGVRVERPPMLNDSPPLIAALAAIASSYLD
ncbi:MAG: ferrochelatase [Caldilineae bacterium]|nr:ferrochelatase [Anaerolineae bacterium]MCB9155435.1 ferrochelatase [Caldilineae bacterium]